MDIILLLAASAATELHSLPDDTKVVVSNVFVFVRISELDDLNGTQIILYTTIQIFILFVCNGTRPVGPVR